MIKIEDIAIKSVSVVVPDQELVCKELGGLFGEKEIKRIVTSSGISRLRISEKNQTASDLCFESAQVLIKDNNLEEIKGIVFVSQTPDFILPSTSATLQSRLGLSSNVVTFDINGGCTGYIHGLYLAVLSASSINGDVLLLAGDTISRHICEKDRSLRLIMGDAGSATIVGPSAGKEMAFSFSRTDRGVDS